MFGEYFALLDYKLSRRKDLDGQIETLAFSPAYKPRVERLRCFRGIDPLAAMTLATEIGDQRRFERPGQLMAYLGLVPSEHSSGEREHRGSITKAGNSRWRRGPRTRRLPLGRHAGTGIRAGGWAQRRCLRHQWRTRGTIGERSTALCGTPYGPNPRPQERASSRRI